MNTDIIIRYMEKNANRTYWRLRSIADHKKITLHEAVILCLKGETTPNCKGILCDNPRGCSCKKGETTQRKGGEK